MKLHIATFCFGGEVPRGGAPRWATDLGEMRPDLKITCPGAADILIGMDYKSIPLYSVSCNLGKGGTLAFGNGDPVFRKAALFTEVFINDTPIGYPFALLLLSDQSDSWFGRLMLKYSPNTMVYGRAMNGRTEYLPATKQRHDDQQDVLASNEEFFKHACGALHISQNACWFVHEINVINQNELRMSAKIVDFNHHVQYGSSQERNDAWKSLITHPVPFAPGQSATADNHAGASSF